MKPDTLAGEFPDEQPGQPGQPGHSALFHRLSGLLLTAAAVTGAVSLVAALLMILTGTIPVVFRSGSMAPAIETGALALVRAVPVSEIKPGDIVSVINASGQRITHRVVSVEAQSVSAERPGQPEAGILLRLKGDANQLPDQEAYRVQQAQRVFFSAPGLGYFLAALQAPVVIFTGGALAAVIVFFAFSPRGSSRRRAPRRRSAAGRRVAHSLAMVVVPLPFLLAVQAPGTLAAFSDIGPASSGALRAAQLSNVPGVINCQDSFPSSTVSWTPAPGLPAEGSYAIQVIRLTADGSVDKTMGYFGTAGQVTTFTFTPEGTLLGLLNGPTQFRINVLAVVTTGGIVNTDGSNILWTSPVSSAATRSIYNYPGILLGLSAHTRCTPS